jgi:hypothetical protein
VASRSASNESSRTAARCSSRHSALPSRGRGPSFAASRHARSRSSLALTPRSLPRGLRT